MTGPRPGQVRAGQLHHPRHPTQHRYPSGAVAALACPHCDSGLVPGLGSFECRRGHVFDIARQGYVSLLGARARTDTGDSAEMVAARTNFLGGGHYQPIASAVAAACRRGSGPILEIGAGTGYYLGAALDTSGPGADGIAIDASKYAARRAAADPRVISVVADAWSALPLREASVDTILSVFAPRHPAEIVRVLRAGGAFVGVTPRPGHLIELRERLSMLTVDDGKADRLADSFADGLLARAADVVEFQMSLGHKEITALVGMGPSAHHLSPDQLAEQIRNCPEPLTVTAAVTVSSFEAPSSSRTLSGPGGTAVPHPE